MIQIVAPFHRLTALALVAFATAITSVPARSSFSESEKKSIKNFWENKVQYTTNPAGAPGSEWCVRLTPSGSKWIREVYRQFQSTKVIPTQDPNGNNPQQQKWTAWIDRQVQRDWAEAETKATDLNSGKAVDDVVKTAATASKLNRKTGFDTTGRYPSPVPTPQEDPCPSDLVAVVGQAPKFAAAVHPMRHSVTFPDGVTVNYVDNVKVRQKYAYYRFADGVNSEGESMKSLPESEVESLIKAAGISKSEEKVMKAVSMLEGGFDSVNTYDTGYVSVGFIQFACLADGTGSLGEMLQHYKSSNPRGFQADFRDYGLDVEGTRVVAFDLETGEEKVGSEAATQIIHDKRLTAAFQRAGLKSKSFRVAQLQSAKKQFYPSDDRIAVSLCGNDCTVRLADIFKSEAGLATLMDRKVNTGKIVGLKENIEKLALQYGIQSASDLSDVEYLLTRSMTYRTDYLVSASLSKPRDMSTELSRKGNRQGRKFDPASGGTPKGQR